MKQFSFNLEVLHKHKQIIEEQERTKLAAIHYEVWVEQQHLQRLQWQQQETLRRLTRKKVGKYDSREIDWFYQYLNRLSMEIDRSEERLSDLQDQLEQQRIQLVRATKDKKMLDNLRSRKEKEFYLAQARLEQKSIDEMVVTQFAHKI